MPLIPIIGLGLFGLFAALLAGSSKSEPTRTSPADPKRVIGDPLAWQDEEIRVAYCAMWNSGIRDGYSMALGAANAVYEGYQWPPPDGAPQDQIDTWLKIRGLTEDAAANPGKHCA